MGVHNFIIFYLLSSCSVSTCSIFCFVKTLNDYLLLLYILSFRFPSAEPTTDLPHSVVTVFLSYCTYICPFPSAFLYIFLAYIFNFFLLYFSSNFLFFSIILLLSIPFLLPFVGFSFLLLLLSCTFLSTFLNILLSSSLSFFSS